MLRKLTAILLVLALVGMFVGGCKDKDETPGTMEDYRQQAASRSTEDYSG